ncbi:Tyrosine recombinase XerC [Allorhodopirellula heiligendammensis]|uniref:Tyrosine recombinase XerC n=1 Tax=Allorhodopirellula heiligendammensis TaxID=2714739 RepID=A0A5C6BG57_9BACT|nr:Tyrosine recombinase XerC [Allorhodopirellula heiligendammensis]
MEEGGGFHWEAAGNWDGICCVRSAQASFLLPGRVIAGDESMGRVSQSETTWHEQRDKWAKIWFEKLCRFHGRKPQVTWEFTADDVIAFLRDHVRRKTPAWKRLKIIQSLICYRRYVQAAPFDDLKFIQTKLEDLTRAEKIKEARLREAGGHTADEIEDVVGHIDPSEPDILQNLRRAVRARQDTLETERAYVANVKAFMRERGLKRQADFAEIHAADVEAHLTDLAVDGNVAPSTQNRAFYALLYVFQHVLKREMGEVQAIRSTKGKQIPTVLSVDEIEQIFAHLHGVHLLIAKLLYGCGMRISEALRLRMKDFDFDRMVIEVHASKGGKSRIVPMPASVVPEIRKWMESRRVLHEHDLEQGQASVCLPKALERKYPAAARELKWQYLFASHRLSRDPRTRVLRRHHLHKDTFPANLRAAVKKAGIHKHISSHVFRHSFATHLLREGTDICTIQELLGHADIKTTRIYLHSLNREDVKVISPLDRMTSHHQTIPANLAAAAADNAADARDLVQADASGDRSVAECSVAEPANAEHVATCENAGNAREVTLLVSELSAPKSHTLTRRSAGPGDMAAKRVSEAEPARAASLAGPPRNRLRWWSHAASWAFQRASVVVGGFLSLS